VEANASMIASGQSGVALPDDEEPCPVETVVGVIGGKWKILILWTLQERGTMRFAELGRAVGDVTQKVLSQQLRELERDGMIARRVYADVPPRVEYSLTPVGESLREPLAVLCAWGERYARQSPTGYPR
jgi:DNA-binding HxlR family transcriptional regulator